jgi:hypothetical protein
MPLLQCFWDHQINWYIWLFIGFVKSSVERPWDLHTG